MYQLFETSSSFSVAQQTCFDFGGTLAIIKTEEENDAVLNFLRTAGQFRTYYYIGMQARNTPQNWRYLDGNSVALRGSNEYQNWGRGEPNNYGGNEGCGAISYSFARSSWNDVNCERQLNFLCEKSE